MLEVLDRFGVNHIDTAAGYGDSELRIAPWLRSRRDDFFLATKTGDRTGDAARASLERSLERLGTDHVDLIQLHDLVEPEDWETAFAPGGAVGALAQARDEGLARAIGVTGHGLRIAAMHRRSLERFDFDSVLLPFSRLLLRDESYRRDVEMLLDTCEQRDVAVQTIKSAARRRWPAQEAGRTHASWYEPVLEPEVVARSVRWVLAHDRLFVNSSSDTRLLPVMLAAAADPAPPPAAEALDADAERLGMTPIFDGAALERI